MSVRLPVQTSVGWLLIVLGMTAAIQAEPPIDFNRQIRPLLSNHCYRCHGPDDAQRKGDLRLDRAADALGDRGGYRVIAAGKPDESELLSRIEAEGDERMPPEKAGRALTRKERELLRRWIAQGARFARHWAYEKPVRHPLPPVKKKDWVQSPIDHFILARLQREGLHPAPEADRRTLIRRVCIDLTGLPPTPAQVQRFLADKSPRAYENLVDRLLQSPAYGERWAAMWLDLARYADSAGYANDPARTIWLYRDWVIRAFNQNMPFDQFTELQLAGDLLAKPGIEQQIATAFHRNTLTNSEGGTNDEEFRNVAIVDRVNTTLQVWMGTTIRCAQCHNHKYDPITQEEYFRVFAFFNNSEDADRANEAPVLQVMTDQQKTRSESLQAQIDLLKKQLKPSDAEVDRQLAAWESRRKAPVWRVLKPIRAEATGGASLEVSPDGTIRARGKRPDKEIYRVELPADVSQLSGVRIEALPDGSLPKSAAGRGDDGSFVLSELRLTVVPKANATAREGRFVRIELPGKQRMIHVAEVQVFSGGKNIARSGKARQSSTGFNGPAKRAIDGNTDGNYAKNSVTHTAIEANPWWEVDLQREAPLERIVVWNRTDNNLQSRLDGYVLKVLDKGRKVVWSKTYAKAPRREQASDLGGPRPVVFRNASATFAATQIGSAKLAGPAAVIDGKAKTAGWSVVGKAQTAHSLALETDGPVKIPQGATLRAELVQNHGGGRTLGRFRIAITQSPAPIRILPQEIESALAVPVKKRTSQQLATLRDFFRQQAKPPKAVVDKIARLEKQKAAIKPTTVPIMRELTGARRRKTRIQLRGNFMVTTKEVREGTPQAFHPFPESQPTNRLGFARWLMHPENPLTARVIVNRYWEQLFGVGLVATSEEFGTQGEPPSHPQLLDWLATELVRQKWDLKKLLKTMVLSAAYRQDSRVTRELAQRDPDNRLLARGPRFRLSAEMIRDQALAVSGLLSHKMFGPPVQPRRPKLGLRAAFGSSTDWETSPGADRYRRAIYTRWRRSLPYPSMAAFDAPTRNVCTIRRGRTNTPLQALVTLNDPVYIEAAQALARRILKEGGKTPSARIDYAFRLCLARPPSAAERERLVKLFEAARARYGQDMPLAKALATDPLGPVPAGVAVDELAAWTLTANVLLNLDECLVKR